ncbi:glycosyltransferase family 2 protein [Chlorogloeopsis sp. ULAP01]|nr:glycosyltransferase family 2 protein [Chlorogloeopsis sp. ULAP01]MDM9381012.1 glycosyltransferase family 2 protein [Chlorogloeopsis sp. ULAP01]
MNKLLTIAIPTYNRAELLDRQLMWLSQAIKGFESECEIIISDNCSPDHTQEIIEKWLNRLGDIQVKVNRNNKNIGVIKNITYCINEAKGEYVWTVGDDDPIQDRTIAYILKNLKESPELSLLILNFSCRYEPTGQIIYERCFDIKHEEVCVDGKAVFQRCLQENHSGVGFMTAQIYRTALAQSAVKKCLSGLDNMELQVYWTAFCAAHGSVKVTKETYVESLFGLSHWMREPKVLLKMQYIDLPKLYVKLMELGYSPEFCSRLVLQHFIKNNWRVFFGALKRWPILTISTIIPYLSLVCKSAFRILLPRKQIEAVPESIVLGN